jgi:diguanylate cyclase (GGDEF)-like protein
MQAELARLAQTDVLTGLPNRRHFETVFAQAWGTSRRTGAPLALILIDADHFKRYNDRYGHAVGDAVLRGLADSLSASVRRPGDLVARVGGEEFAVLLPRTDHDGAMRVSETIHRAIAGFAMPSVGIDPGTVTVSLGLAVDSGGGTAEDLYRRADAALYEAKAGGRNQTRSAA